MLPQETQNQTKNETNLTDRKAIKGHMALRNNVYDLRMELWHVLSPLEMFLVDIVIDKTIKWRIKQSKITIQELMERTKQADTHIYAALRNLKKKGIIIWNKHNHYSTYGLNEEYFGGLLIKKHEDALQERRKKIKVVVDNSKSTDESSQCDRRITSVEETGAVSTRDEPRQSFDSQVHDIIDEERSLKTLLKDISSKTLLKDSKNGFGESFTLSKGTGIKRQLEDPKQEWQRQLSELKAAGLG